MKFESNQSYKSTDRPPIKKKKKKKKYRPTFIKAQNNPERQERYGPYIMIYE